MHCCVLILESLPRRFWLVRLHQFYYAMGWYDWLFSHYPSSFSFSSLSFSFRHLEQACKNYSVQQLILQIFVRSEVVLDFLRLMVLTANEIPNQNNLGLSDLVISPCLLACFFFCCSRTDSAYKRARCSEFNDASVDHVFCWKNIMVSSSQNSIVNFHL